MKDKLSSAQKVLEIKMALQLKAEVTSQLINAKLDSESKFVKSCNERLNALDEYICSILETMSQADQEVLGEKLRVWTE